MSRLRRVITSVFTACLLGSAGVAGVPTDLPVAAQPFAPASGPGGHRFTALAPEETGIDLVVRYDDPKMWGERYREFSLGAIGTGVAIGDYDGDGRPDVFAVAKTGGSRLYRNLGNFRFEDVTARAGLATPPGGPWQQGVAFADIDNDGWLDLYICRFGAPNLLYVNQGDGTFREEAAQRGLALSDASGMAAFCDYDRDGWLDVYVQTNLLDAEKWPTGRPDRLFRNVGGGKFEDVTERAGIGGEAQGHSATWWDYDEDGWPDLYVANDFKEPDLLYRNNRDGTFTNTLSWVVPHTPHSSMGADLGDVNNDGHIDLLVADMAATTRIKDHRGMAKQRAALIENDVRPESAPQYMRNALFLNSGAGVMMDAAYLAGLDATDWTWALRWEDLDNDGWLDLFVTNGMIRELHSDDITRRMQARESIADRVRLIKATPVFAEKHRAFQNLGDLRFADRSDAWGLGFEGVGFGAAFGDLDGDGDLDLIFSSFDQPLTVCRNDLAAGNAVQFELRGHDSNRFGVGAVVRIETAAGVQVRSLVLARGYLSTSEPMLHFGLGRDPEIRRATIEWPSGRRQVLEHLAANRRYTIAEPADAAAPATNAPAPAPAPAVLFTEVSSSLRIAIARREKPSATERAASSLAPFRFHRPGPSAAFSDFDRDGEDDLVIGGSAGEPAQLFSNLSAGRLLPYGIGTFNAHATVADGPILAIDADADGDQDLLVTKAGVAAPDGAAEYSLRLWLNDGSGRFTAAPEGVLPALTISAGAACAADFEHSGRLGVFIGGRLVPGRYPDSPRSALLAWRGGRYVDVTEDFLPQLASSGMVTSARWSDVDDDGWADLVVTSDWGAVRCYRNLDGRRFEDMSDAWGFRAAGTGWWSSLASGDFNGDGRPDFAVGNTGLNTRYTASPEAPARLYAGVSVDGSPGRLVEAQFVDGAWYPLRDRETMTKAFPSLSKRYPTAESYAKATLADVFPDPILAAATKLEATELRSGVFLSQPDGRFRFSPLPRLAQLAPVQGLAAGDFDGDGRSDLLLVGNSYAPGPETGRFDGGIGWLLRGDGAGGFTPVSASESGVLVRRDARALALTDLNGDGWPDFLVTRNNDRALVFQHAGLDDRHSFSVVLAGPPGNPTAIGSRVSVWLSDGSRQTVEVQAGGGYFSQSGARIFFGYPDHALPVRMRIRWPGGQETEQMFSERPPRLLRLSAP